MLVKDILTKTTVFFRNKGYESARLDSELLISNALKWPRVKLYLNYEYPLTEAEVSECREFVRRRGAGEPVAYILGKKDFYNQTFFVSPAVLIPRPETEQIVEEVTQWLKKEAIAEPKMIDLGTGSGCIGICLLIENPDSKLLAVDLSADAVEIAKKNAEALGVMERATYVVSDAATFTNDFGLVDVLVANPPYIAHNDTRVEANVKKFEPNSALFSDNDGLSHIEAWAKKAAEVVRPGGLIMFEMGNEQGRASLEIFEKVGAYEKIQVVKDMAGHERFIKAIRTQAN